MMATANDGCPRRRLLLLVLLCILNSPVSAVKKSYVVYMGGHSHSREESSLLAVQERAINTHHNLLESCLGSKKKADDAIFYSYTRHINGFAANLEEEEAAEISKRPGVVSVFLNQGRKLHTTRSWSFLNLERNGRVPKSSLWAKAKFGRDSIIGNLDTGVWPESASFADEGMGPIPARWRGQCDVGQDDTFRCNRKLIGARYFNKGYEAFVGTSLNSTFNSPRDMGGHGSHTLSTAGGRFVEGANVFGFGNGTAKGGSPEARVVPYRVCFPPANGSECFDADILAAFDAAIADGVDVLSVSLGGDPSPYFTDGISIGAFHAVRNGITVVCSAGNSGPEAGTVSNLAPWIITVGASTIDREFTADVILGVGTKLKGQSLSSNAIARKNGELFPLINAVDGKFKNATNRQGRRCLAGALDPAKVKGKIVACLRGTNGRVEKGMVVHLAGGLGMILANDRSTGNEIIADAHVLPATHITYSDGVILYTYLNSTKSPVAYVTAPKTMTNTAPAPFMAAFSSQGPNTINPEFLKPDITAPGVSIIAAYTEATSPTELEFDKRRVKFNTESGTSMSCPHIAGVVGLLKTMYPHWSPAAIRSAIMTSARTRDNTRAPMRNASFVKATPFSYGSGHVRPNRAVDPGLVYDTSVEDYLNFLCAIGYNSTLLSTFTDVGNFTCPAEPVTITDLNYPSVTVPELVGSVTVARRLKNVGSPGNYTVRVVPPPGASAVVEPSKLEFREVGEEKGFTVTLTPKRSGGGYAFGRMVWSDGVHFVRTPLVVQM